MKQTIIIIAFVACSLEVGAQNRDSLAIVKLVENFITAFNEKDLNLYVSLFALDADFYNWQGKYTHGRKEIEDFHAGVFKRLGPIRLNILSKSIRFLKPDVATVVVNEENTNMLSSDGKPLPNRTVNLVWVVTKENSEWLIKMNHTAMLNDGSKPADSKN